MIKSNHGIRHVDSTKRSLNIIAHRNVCIDQNFKLGKDDSNQISKNIMHIPDYLMSLGN